MNLKRRQELSIDGIETSCAMASICYSRLRLSINLYSSIEEDKNEGSSSDLQDLILLDAWSLIDIIYRLKILVSQTPGLKKDTFVTLFQKSTSNVEIFRNFVQHLNNEIPTVENTGWPIWGAISWHYMTSEMEKQGAGQIKAFVSGHLGNVDGLPVVNPLGKTIELPVDLISLSASNTMINLSEIFRITKQFSVRFQSGLKRAEEILQNSNGNESTLLQIYLTE